MKTTNISLKRLIKEAILDQKKQQLLESLAKPEPAFQMLEEQYGIPNVPLTDEEKKKMLDEISTSASKRKTPITSQELLDEINQLFL